MKAMRSPVTRLEVTGDATAVAASVRGSASADGPTGSLAPSQPNAAKGTATQRNRRRTRRNRRAGWVKRENAIGDSWDRRVPVRLDSVVPPERRVESTGSGHRRITWGSPPGASCWGEWSCCWESGVVVRGSEGVQPSWRPSRNDRLLDHRRRRGSPCAPISRAQACPEWLVPIFVAVHKEDSATR